MALLQGDHQPETKWYNYDEEVEEPLPCQDRNIRLKYVLQQPKPMSDLEDSRRDSILSVQSKHKSHTMNQRNIITKNFINTRLGAKSPTQQFGASSPTRRKKRDLKHGSSIRMKDSLNFNEARGSISGLSRASRMSAKPPSQMS